MSLVLVDPGLRSTNTGDAIISQSLHEVFVRPLVALGTAVQTVPMHGVLTDSDRDLLSAADEVLVSGTNLLSVHMRFSSTWDWKRRDIDLLRSKLTFFGPGWWQYQRGPVDALTARWLRQLEGRRLSVVRDEYSAQKLTRAGLRVRNAACPTMWRLHRQVLPGGTSRVVVTLTDYNQDPGADTALLDLLDSLFDEVLFWPQGPGDETYVRSILNWRGRVLDRDLEAFDEALRDDRTSYVGLRLHGGIRALQLGRPALIIAIDNRAREIARTTGLVTASRFDLEGIRRLCSRADETVLTIDREAVRTFLGQWELPDPGTVGVSS